jgi:hypothetical protein
MAQCTLLCKPLQEMPRGGLLVDLIDRPTVVDDTRPPHAAAPSTPASEMSQVQLGPHPTSVLDDDAWGDLLDFIEDRRVIPIVGPELLKVDTETGPRLLYDWLAEKLAAKLVSLGAWPARGGLHPAAWRAARCDFRTAACADSARADHRL